MKYLLTLFTILSTLTVSAQTVDEDQLGAWYMYFYNTSFKESNWGVQGDFQYRDWQIFGDKEQLLLRSGITYTPSDSGIKFTLGYGYVSSGAFGDSEESSVESRIYQEGLFGQRLFKKLLITHRLRFEQRWVENQDFRTRYRYNLFVNIPFNNDNLVAKTWYFAFYNELFINAQRDIGEGRSVEYFDRNRTYLGLGYALSDKIRFQTGWMKQTTTSVAKGQLQFSMHHTF
ncbi:Protein of unknown function [Flavobacteriaceae bacterium MAR_2010_188]|nr:Protein of unknown function [Flavobacteriaceae bacterium MAR_2010_188]